LLLSLVANPDTAMEDTGEAMAATDTVVIAVVTADMVMDMESDRL